MSQLQCIECFEKFEVLDLRYSCNCGGLLEVVYPDSMWKNLNVSLFEKRLSSRKKCDISGVWRFREAILGLSENEIVTHPEGRTRLYDRVSISQYAGIEGLF